MDDITAISQLKYRYLRSLDTKEWEEFADCFVPEATGDYNGLVFADREALVAYMRENLGEDVASANLVISDGQVMLATSDQEMIDLIRQGQGVLNLLPLEGVKAEIDAVVALPSPSSAAQGAGPAEPTAEAATGR